MAHKEFACKVACASGAGLPVSFLIWVVVYNTLFTDQRLRSSKTSHLATAVQGVAVQAVAHGAPFRLSCDLVHDC